MDGLEDGIDAMGHSGGPVGTGDEVSQARENADVDIRLDLAKSLSKNVQMSAGQNLSLLQVRMSPDARLVDVALDVGVAQQGKGSHLSGGHSHEKS